MSQVFPGSHDGRGGGDGDGDRDDAQAAAAAEMINERLRGSSSSSSASASSASGRCCRFLVALRPRLLPHSLSPWAAVSAQGGSGVLAGALFTSTRLCVCGCA